MMEIPGYFYDDVRRKYFKTTNETKKTFAIASAAAKQEERIHFKRVKPNHDRISFLTNRERGNFPNKEDFLVGSISDTSLKFEFSHPVVSFDMGPTGGFVAVSDGTIHVAQYSNKVSNTQRLYKTSEISCISRIDNSGNSFVSTFGSAGRGGNVTWCHSQQGQMVDCKRIYIGKDSLWCMAMNPSRSTGSVGGSRSKIAVFDLRTIRLKSDFHLKVKSDILAQTWINDDILASGCRNGKIFLYDIRCQVLLAELDAKSPVSNLKTFRNVMYYSCINGVIKDWTVGRPSTFEVTIPNEVKPVSFDFVADSQVVAVGDCGSCSLYTLHDQALIDEISIPKGISKVQTGSNQADGFWISHEQESKSILKYMNVNNVRIRQGLL